MRTDGVGSEPHDLDEPREEDERQGRTGDAQASGEIERQHNEDHADEPTRQDDPGRRKRGAHMARHEQPEAEQAGGARRKTGRLQGTCPIDHGSLLALVAAAGRSEHDADRHHPEDQPRSGSKGLAGKDRKHRRDRALGRSDRGDDPNGADAVGGIREEEPAYVRSPSERGEEEGLGRIGESRG